MIPSLAPRDDFPSLQEVVYLDTAANGLVPDRIRREATEFWCESTPGRAASSALRAAAYERPREAVARILGVDRETIAITTSASEALAQFAWWLRPSSPLNIVSIDLDFPTVTYPWLRLASETGVEVRLVQARDDPSTLSLDAIARLVDERTAAISVSHVQYATGYRLDLRELAELARAAGARLVVDVAQSLGAVPVETEGIDVLVGHAGKWLCGETGAGFCYLRPEVAHVLEPPFVGWRSTAEPYAIDATSFRLAPGARRLEVSSSSYVARFLLGAAVDYILEYDPDAILAHNLALGSLFMRGLNSLGATLVSPSDDIRRSGIVATSFLGLDSVQIANQLADRGVAASARLGALRFSFHLYNDESDVQRALDALAQVVSE